MVSDLLLQVSTSLTPSIHRTMPKVGISRKVEAFTDPPNPRSSGSTASQEKHRAEDASNDHVSSFHRSCRFPRRLSCHHVDQGDEKASSRRSRPRPPCTSKAKHQGNDEDQVLEDRREVAEAAAALVLSWLAQGA